MKKAAMIVSMALMIFVTIPAGHARASSVQDQLQESIHKLIDILKNPAMQGEAATRQRRDAMRGIIYERFNFERMSQLSLGRHWRPRTPEERQIFVTLFGKLLEQTYASRIEEYTDQRVEFLKEMVDDRRAQIHTKIIDGKLELPIDYRLYLEDDGSWRVYDIVVEGVSLVNNYRSQFDQMLQREDFDKLIEDLKQKTAE